MPGKGHVARHKPACSRWSRRRPIPTNSKSLRGSTQYINAGTAVPPTDYLRGWSTRMIQYPLIYRFRYLPREPDDSCLRQQTSLVTCYGLSHTSLARINSIIYLYWLILVIQTPPPSALSLLFFDLPPPWAWRRPAFRKMGIINQWLLWDWSTR